MMQACRVSQFALLVIVLVSLAGPVQPVAHAGALPPAKRVLVPLMGWERGTWNAQFSVWLAAMGSGGYAIESPAQPPQLMAAQMLGSFDAVAMTTRSAQQGVLEPAFQQALIEFVRQGGGLILVVTADQHLWQNTPISLALPTTFYRPGPGWGTAAACRSVKLQPTGEHPAVAGLDWADAPPVSVVWRTPAPDSDFFRGALQMLGPREDLLKPSANANWAEILVADDAERTPVAVAGTFGRGRVLVWGVGLGGDPNKSDVPAPFTQWQGFALLWRQIVAWAAGAGKIAAPQPAVWVVGDAVDNPKGDAAGPWKFVQTVSYPLAESGLSHATDPASAQAAIVLKAEPERDADLARLAAAGKPLVVCDPKALDGALKARSPLAPEPAAAPAMPPITFGAAAPPSKAAAKAAPQSSATEVKDVPLLPPAQWKFRATNSVTFQHDMLEKWCARDFDDAAWETRPGGDAAQKIGGKQVPFTGALWYRAHINLPPAVPPHFAWTFRVRQSLFRSQLRAWIDGEEQKLDGWSLRLDGVKPGEHVLAIRVYDAGGGSYWQGSRELYDNHGLLAVTAEVRPPSAAPRQSWGSTWGFAGPTDVTRGACSKLPADAPVLFRTRAEGDRDWLLTLSLTEEQAGRTPLLLLDEPGLIRTVTVNGKPIDRIAQGAWDGVSGGNTTAFLLDGVLKAGDNTVRFRPDLTRLRNLDYPVSPETLVPCGLPRLEFTGDLQALVAEDPELRPLVPNRLFKPGAVRAAMPGARVLLRWNDGRPALVEHDGVFAFTSDIAAQLNAAIVHRWQVPWETAGPWDYQSGDGIPRGDSLLCENAAPLLSAILARKLAAGGPRLVDVRPLPASREVELTIENPGEAGDAILASRVLNWQCSIIASTQTPLKLAQGRNAVKVFVPTSGFAGEAMKDEFAIRASLRTADGAAGLAYIEKVFELPPAIRATIETDSLAARVAAGAIPERLPYNPDFRGRHLWWPLLYEDPGSMVYLDGETAHFRLAFTNTTAEPRVAKMAIELTAQGRREVEMRLQFNLAFAPGQRLSQEFEHPLTGGFEPYLLRVSVDGRPAASRALYAVKPWKRCFNIDSAPRDGGISFNCYIPFSYLQQPDNIIPSEQYKIHRDPHVPGPFPELLEWWIATGTGTQGHGGGVNGYNGLTQGFGWGPFYRPAFNAPDQMSVLPNGQPVMHYLADGLRRQHIGPARYEVADFWVNYWVPLNWNTLSAFREWLAANDAPAVTAFHPQTMGEARQILRDRLAVRWNEWQAEVAIGGWSAIRDAAAPGSLFWCQAEHAWIATQGVRSVASDDPADGRKVASFLSGLFGAADADPATSRMGWGYRFRSFTETTAAALVPAMHLNVTTLRHVYFLNEQRMSNAGNATPETYRAHAYDTIWAATVRPDGTLRAVVDTPPSEITIYPNQPWSGLKFGNLLYNQMYQLATVAEPQQALGLLWMARPASAVQPDARTVYETLCNAGVPLSAMIGGEFLEVAQKTGAAGVVCYATEKLDPREAARLGALAAAKLPVVCLVPPGSADVKATLPAGVTAVDLPAQFSPEAVRGVAQVIGAASGDVLSAGDGTCVYGFHAQGRAFVVVQNMWGTARSVKLRLAAGAAAIAGDAAAVNLNDNTPLATRTDAGTIELNVPVQPYDAVLVMLIGIERK